MLRSDCLFIYLHFVRKTKFVYIVERLANRGAEYRSILFYLFIFHIACDRNILRTDLQTYVML